MSKLTEVQLTYFTWWQQELELNFVDHPDAPVPPACKRVHKEVEAIIWTNDGISLIGPLGTNFNEIHTFHWGKGIWKCFLPNGGHFR